jgi:hypothetical protein
MSSSTISPIKRRIQIQWHCSVPFSVPLSHWRMGPTCQWSHMSVTQWHREWHRAMSPNLSPQKTPRRSQHGPGSSGCHRTRGAATTRRPRRPPLAIVPPLEVHNSEDLDVPGTTTVSLHCHIHMIFPLIVLHMHYTSYLATVPPHGAAGSPHVAHEVKL